MRRVFLFLVVLALPLHAAADPENIQTMIFEHVVDGATIEASGTKIALWGVRALDPADPASFAANLYLKTILEKSVLACAEKQGGDRPVRHCYSDGADIGSLMIQMGLATASDPYYEGEEETARANRRGTWRDRHKSL
jgi:endonuclease YncB( thermonuclease family)